MNIICGKDKIAVSQISVASVHQLYCVDLWDAEEQINGPFEHRCKKNLSLSQEDIRILNEHWYAVSWGLKKVGSNGNGTKQWKQSCDLTRTATFEMDYRGVVTWEYKVNYGRDAAGWSRIGFERETLDISKHIIPALRSVVNYRKPSKANQSASLFDLLFSSPEKEPDISSEAKSDINPLYERLAKMQRANDEIENRYQLRQTFIEEHTGKRGLKIYMKHGGKRVYVEGICGFDLDKKQAEIEQKQDDYRKQQEAQERHEQKLRNSENKGEQGVEYALKWLLATDPSLFIPIAGDCESQHRYNCILLKNPTFINEPQEFDHILVSAGGIIVIETKHWKGSVEIRKDGKWIRKTDGAEYGVESPKMQMRRHEAVLQSILPDVPIHSLLCFTHASLIIDGRDNFNSYPIVTIDCLDEAIKCLCSVQQYSAEEMQKIVAIIEVHKINKQ